VFRTCLIVFMCAFATAAIAADEPSSPNAAAVAVAAKGKMLVGADGGRLGVISRVTADGGAQIILDGKLITIPASTLTDVDGKLTTSLTKSAVLSLH
jgi:hypothetical protein